MLSIIRETVLVLVYAIGACVGAIILGASSGLLAIYVWGEVSALHLVWVFGFSLAGLAFGALTIMISANDDAEESRRRPRVNPAPRVVSLA